MRQSTNVDVLSVCTADGGLQPLRFRFEDEQHFRRLGKILEILSCEEVRYVGVEAYVFTCRVLLGEQEQYARLRYSVRGHRWSLFQELY